VEDSEAFEESKGSSGDALTNPAGGWADAGNNSKANVSMSASNYWKEHLVVEGIC